MKMCLTEKAFQGVSQRSMVDYYRSVCGEEGGESAAAATQFARKCRGLNITPVFAASRQERVTESRRRRGSPLPALDDGEPT